VTDKVATGFVQESVRNKVPPPAFRKDVGPANSDDARWSRCQSRGGRCTRKNFSDQALWLLRFTECWFHRASLRRSKGPGALQQRLPVRSVIYPLARISRSGTMGSGRAV